MFLSRRRRVVLASLATVASLAFWGSETVPARGPGSAGPAPGLADACEQALRSRLPSHRPLALVATPRVEVLGGGSFRLLSSFEAGNGRTSFAREATAQDGAYEVAGLTLVQW